MKKYLRVSVAVMLLAFFVVGCGRTDYFAIAENHEAVEMYRNGVWEIRYISGGEVTVGSKVKEVQNILAVNVNEDMTEKEMLKVLDYFEFSRNAYFENDEYKGERKTDYTCFAVFYKEETDEEICRIKYRNGRDVEPLDEDEPLFPVPALRSGSEERKGSLP